jgi:hypothetical protein
MVLVKQVGSLLVFSSPPGSTVGNFHPTSPCYSHLIGPLSCVTLADFISPADSSISLKSIPEALPRYFRFMYLGLRAASKL